MKENNNVVDFGKFKEKKLKDQEDKYNLELLQNLLCKKPDELTGGEKFTYNQIKLIFPFQLKQKYTMGIIEFRGVLYVVNATPEQTFEYLGKLEDMIWKYLGWK